MIQPLYAQNQYNTFKVFFVTFRVYMTGTLNKLAIQDYEAYVYLNMGLNDVKVIKDAVEKLVKDLKLKYVEKIMLVSAIPYGEMNTVLETKSSSVIDKSDVYVVDRMEE